MANPKEIKCKWNEQEFADYWETDCGDAFCFTDGGPKDNHMKFCCYCGKKLQEKKHRG